MADQNQESPISRTRTRDVASSLSFLSGMLGYLAAASADIVMTLRGLNGVLDREANPFLRGLMGEIGIMPALLLAKTAILAVCVAAALIAVPALRDKPDWLWKVPSTNAARRWVRSGDRSWVGYVPLYLTAIFQALAAASWLLMD